MVKISLNGWNWILIPWTASKALPSRDQIDVPIQEQLIVEYYPVNKRLYWGLVKALREDVCMIEIEKPKITIEETTENYGKL